jgi:hypothetical protein
VLSVIYGLLRGVDRGPSGAALLVQTTSAEGYVTTSSRVPCSDGVAKEAERRVEYGYDGHVLAQTDPFGVAIAVEFPEAA